MYNISDIAPFFCEYFGRYFIGNCFGYINFCNCFTHITVVIKHFVPVYVFFVSDDRLFICKTAVKFQHCESCNPNILTVVIWNNAVSELNTFDKVCDYMLTSAGRTGVFHEAHGNTRLKKCLKDLTCSLLVVRRNEMSHAHQLVNCTSSKICHLFAVDLAREDIGYFPVNKTDVFCDHVTEPRAFQLRRS